MNKVKSIVAGFYLAIATIGLTAVSAHNANATLIAEDLLEVAGCIDCLTRDAASGLEWLDVDLTIDISFFEITGGTAISNGGALNGLNPITGAAFASNPFRHATIAELLILFSSAAIPNPNSGFTDANYLPVVALKSLLGPIIGDPEIEGTQGVLADVMTVAGIHWGGRIQACASTKAACTGFSDLGGPFFTGNAITTADFGGGVVSPSLGHFLARRFAEPEPPTRVPEPSTLALFATGLAGLGFMGWRRRRRSV